MPTRRSVLITVALAPAAAFATRPAFAAYPDRVIHFVVPFAAGGNADIVGRVIADAVGGVLKQTTIVDNRAGAGGAIGAEFAARANPDGYTLLIASNGPMTVNPFVNAKLAYDPMKDFAPIALTSYVPHVLAVSTKLGVATFADVVAKSKTKSINIGTSGIGSATHLTLARLTHASGADITSVPYRSGGALLPDVIAGSLDGAMTEMSTVMELHKAGQVRIVGTASSHRSTIVPDVPTFDESGVKGFFAQSFIGVVAPAALPPEQISILAKAISTALAAGGPTATKLQTLASDVATPEEQTPAGFAAFLKRDYAESGEAAKLAGIVPQ